MPIYKIRINIPVNFGISAESKSKAIKEAKEMTLEEIRTGVLECYSDLTVESVEKV